MQTSDIIKRLGATLLLLLPALCHAQNHAFVIDDTAQYVVDRYLRMLAIDELPEDSVLALETAVTVYGKTDTVWMRRWYMPSNKFRIEIWHKDRLMQGYITNGDKRFRRYNRYELIWEPTTESNLDNFIRSYDFRSPLYQWREKGATLTWNGTTTLKDHLMQVVKVSCPDMFDRYYMFDADNGLLTLIFETDKMNGTAVDVADHPSHISWKGIQEYLPVNRCLLPSEESFMRNDELTILRTTVKLLPRNDELFTKD